VHQIAHEIVALDIYFSQKRSSDQEAKKNNTHFSLRDDVINRVVLLKLAAKEYST
jgi:hypothetical protein